MPILLKINIVSFVIWIKLLCTLSSVDFFNSFIIVLNTEISLLFFFFFLTLSISTFCAVYVVCIFIKCLLFNIISVLFDIVTIREYKADKKGLVRIESFDKVSYFESSSSFFSVRWSYVSHSINF